MKDIIIIGAGPAGLAAAIYGIRAGLDILVIEKLACGGQVLNTAEVENYPGFVEPVSGWELMSNMENQARRLGVEIINTEVLKIEKDGIFTVNFSSGKSETAKTVIIASGASYQKLEVPGEAEFTGRGVSYCATCDGAFFRDKVTAVVGGGDTALEEALFLTKFASKVYLIHRRNEFRGAKILQNRVLDNKKIEPVYDSVVVSVNGNEKVISATIKNVKTNRTSDLAIDGIFIFVGIKPNTKYLPAEILNEKGEVKIDSNFETSIKGLFAAGDLRANSKRQILMAASDGATAVLNAYGYIQSLQ